MNPENSSTTPHKKSKKITYRVNKEEPPLQAADRVSILLEEYSACNRGYNNRDSMIFSEFSVLIAVFSGLLAIVVYISDRLSQPVLSLCIFILGILGFLSIMSISIDIQSTHSSKVAIRKRMRSIEKEVNTITKGNASNGKDIIKLWTKEIENRKKYSLERFFKPNRKPDQKNREGYEKEIDFLNASMYSIILLWIFMIAVFLGLNNYPLSLIFVGIVIMVFSLPIFYLKGDKNARK